MRGRSRGRERAERVERAEERRDGRDGEAAGKGRERREGIDWMMTRRDCIEKRGESEGKREEGTKSANERTRRTTRRLETALLPSSLLTHLEIQEEPMQRRMRMMNLELEL